MYGLCFIGRDGRIVVPPEAADEYGFRAGDVLIAMTGSRRSGGFALGRPDTIRRGGITPLVRAAEGLVSGAPGPVRLGGRLLAAVTLSAEGNIVMLPDVLTGFQLHAGDPLAAGRGSYLALAFLARGPIMTAARGYPGLPVYRC